MRHGRLRRWWWRWRLRVAERKLHRANAERDAFNAHPHGHQEGYVDIRYVSEQSMRDRLTRNVGMATHKVVLLRNLLNELPSMKLIGGGKSDEAANG